MRSFTEIQRKILPTSRLSFEFQIPLRSCIAYPKSRCTLECFDKVSVGSSLSMVLHIFFAVYHKSSGFCNGFEIYVNV